MKKRILFVDDEPSILEVLRHMLKSMAGQWEMTFARSGQEALEMMARSPFEVVVTDVRMPGMDGADLLSSVKKQYPQTMRLVFSGESEREVIYRLIGSTHQFLLKPYDLNTIRDTIARAFTLRDMLSAESLEKMVSQIKTLPSLPDLYYNLVKELQAPYPSVDKVGDIISKDLAMSAKILQLVNSAFFGLRQHVSNPAQAAALLGLDLLKSLVLMVHIFTQPAQLTMRNFSLKSLWTHSLSVGSLSQEVALQQNIEKKASDDAFIAGLFHDLGKLILVANMPEQYNQVLTMVHAKHLLLTDLERQILGASHAEVGAYLLGLWGFSDAVIEAVAFHHNPGKCRDQSFGPLTTAHVANIFDHEVQPVLTGELPVKLDMDYLKHLGLDSRVPQWRQACTSAKNTLHGDLGITI